MTVCANIIALQALNRFHLSAVKADKPPAMRLIRRTLSEVNPAREVINRLRGIKTGSIMLFVVQSGLAIMARQGVVTGY